MAENVVNVVDPGTGQIGSLPESQAAEATSQGYRLASPEQVKTQIFQDKYNTPAQTAGAYLEGAAGISSLGGSSLAEKELSNLGVPGLSPEEQRMRAEAHPYARMAGQITPFLTGEGEFAGGANLITNAGRLAGEAITNKIGSTAARMAVESALMKGTDEVQKLFTSDKVDNPVQAAETALSNMGYAGAIGGGIGAAGAAVGYGVINPLWKATAAPKLQQLLGFISSRANGESDISSDLEKSLGKIGIEPNSDMSAALSSDPGLNSAFLDLAQSESSSGKQVQQSLSNFRNQAIRTTLSAVGKTEEDMSALGSLSKNEIGSNIKNQLVNDFKTNLEGAVSGFDEAKMQYGSTSFAETEKKILADQIASVNLLGGYNKRGGSEVASFLNGIIDDLPKQENLRDLINLRSNVLSEIWAKPELRMASLYGKIKPLFEQAENQLLDQGAGKEGQQVFENLQGSKAAWSAYMDQAAQVGQRLKLGKYSTANQFLQKLSAMKDENFIDRLSGKNDADWLQYVSESHPEVAGQIKDYQLSKLIQSSSMGAKPGETLNPEKLISSLQRMTQESPELKKFLISEQGAKNLDVLNQALGQIKSLKWNYSNTGPTVLRALKNMAAGPLALISALETHNPLAGLMIGGASHYLAREAPDAVKLALMRFMASSEPIEAGAFKNMVEFIDHVYKGESQMNRAVKNLFRAGSEVISSNQIPSEKETSRLDQKLEAVQKNPEELASMGGSGAHYLPSEHSSLALTAGNGIAYLQKLKPKETIPSPLDRPLEPNAAQKETYDKALQVAENPLVILPKIKEGTITPEDLQHLNALYPNFYNRIKPKVYEEIAQARSEGEIIPYKTRMGLSIFLGEPLDSTMTPMGIQLKQAANKMNIAPSQQQTMANPRRSSPSLGKMSENSLTASQRAESRHLK